MLPIGFIGSLILDFAKKRTKNEKHLMRNVILCNILLFLLFGLVVGEGTVIYGNRMRITHFNGRFASDDYPPICFHVPG